MNQRNKNAFVYKEEKKRNELKSTQNRVEEK